MYVINVLYMIASRLALAASRTRVALSLSVALLCSSDTGVIHWLLRQLGTGGDIVTGWTRQGRPEGRGQSIAAAHKDDKPEKQRDESEHLSSLYR